MGVAHLNRIWDEPGRIDVLDEVDSTSDEARRRLARDDGPGPPFVVVARRQTAGRGRGSNTWYADEGSLCWTAAFDPRACGLRPEHEPRLALAYAAVLIASLEREIQVELRGARLGIRWPNDLEADGRKFGGLLPEKVEAPQGPIMLFGVGINVTTDLDLAPRDVRRMATTLDALAGGLFSRLNRISYRQAYHRAALSQDVDRALDEAVARLAHDDPALAEEWAARDALRGRPVRVRLPNRVMEGVGAGIDAEGRLRVATPAGVEALAGGIVLRDA